MSRVRPVFVLLAVIVILVASSSQLFAQATRTWVSGVGDDLNPCSRTAPCKTFAGAFIKTAAGGVINVLDPGGFGGLTITKSITIDATGSFGGILVSGTNGLVINAAPTDVVVLKGLEIHGFGTGLKGVNFLAGSSLVVEDCLIYGFTHAGISFTPSTGTDTKLFVKNTTLCNNTSSSTSPLPSGISILPTGSVQVHAFIEKAQIEKNPYGLVTGSQSFTTISDSSISGSNQEGIHATGISQVNVNNSTVSNNQTGIRVNGTNATVRLNNSVVVSNNRGLVIGASGGEIISLGNNAVLGNPGGDGAPTSTVAPK